MKLIERDTMDSEDADCKQQPDEDTKHKRDRDHSQEQESPHGPFKKAKFAWQIKGDKSKVISNSAVDLSGQSSTDSASSTVEIPVTDQCQSSYSTDSNNDDSLHCSCGQSSSQAKHDQTVTNSIDDSNSSDELLERDVIEIERCLRQSSEGVEDISSAYWRRRAPFDVLRTTVTIAANSDCLPALRQREELGCAIVDNVFNRTLEEIGISPNQKNNQGMMRIIERALENHGIETAISSQGLQIQSSENQGGVSTARIDSTENITDSESFSEINVGHLSSSQSCQSLPSRNLERDHCVQMCPSRTDDLNIRHASRTDDVNIRHASRTDDVNIRHASRTDDVNIRYASSTDDVNIRPDSRPAVILDTSHSSKSASNVNGAPHEDTEIVLDLAVSAAIHTRGINMTSPQK